jgi:outer membrane protein OmpA-like peptidoglycan-associated protein
MRKILVGLAMFAVAAAGSVQAQQFQADPAAKYSVIAYRAVEQGTISGVVAAPDPTGKSVTVKTPAGTTKTLTAVSKVTGLEKAQVDDAVVAKWYRSATFMVDPKNAPKMSPETVEAFEAASRRNTVIEAAGVATTGTATVDAVDATAKTITFKTPDNKVWPVKVENPVLLSGVKPGMQVDYSLVDTMAYEVTVTPKPPPPPPPPPAPTKAKLEGKKIVISEMVFFQVDKAVILPESFGLLDDVAMVMKNNPDINVRVEGHTSKDPISVKRGKAGYDYNMKLSDARAKAVKEYLVTKGGIDAKRLEAVGFGWNQPIAPNNTKAGRDRNKRVDFTVTN